MKFLAPQSHSPFGQRPFCPQSLCCSRFLTVRPQQLPGATLGAGLSVHKQSIMRPTSVPSRGSSATPPAPPPASGPAASHSLAAAPPPHKVFLICRGAVTRSAFLPGLISFAPRSQVPAVRPSSFRRGDQIAGNSMFSSLPRLVFCRAGASRLSRLPPALLTLPCTWAAEESWGARRSVQGSESCSETAGLLSGAQACGPGGRPDGGFVQTRSAQTSLNVLFVLCCCVPPSPACPTSLC